ncbi:MAG TPA: PEP-CTERM sorting domain-containing protein [Pirellulales bacterium]|jgi:hypothetical protein|nr:PEP-CTERM sorting domain-containing protein [Pirellulales bacterium]
MAQIQHFAARFTGMVLLAIAAAALVGDSHCWAAEQNRSYLYEKFQNGDIPDQQDFKDLIDSSLNLLDDGISRKVVTDSTGLAMRFDVGAVIGPDLTFTDSNSIAGLSNDWWGNFGFLALSFLQNSEIHYGYLQLESIPSPGSPYTLFVQYLVFEDQPNLAITASVVPEPSSLALGLFATAGLALVAARKRRARP